MIDLLSIEIELSSVWALSDGKYESAQVKHIKAALSALHGLRPRRTCNWVSRATGGDHTCRTNPVFSDDFWNHVGECPFCGRKNEKSRPVQTSRSETA